MGFIRGALAVIIGTLLFVSVLLGALLLTFSSSLKYENVKETLVPAVRELIGQSDGLTEGLESMSSAMKTYCENNQEYTFQYGETTMTIPCTIIEQGTTAIVDYGIGKMIEQIYYKQYDCDFIDCFKQGELPIFVISQKSRDFWTSKFYLVLLAFVLLTLLMFFIIQKKSGLPIMLGSFFVIVSLIIWKIGSLIMNLMNAQIKSLIEIFFSSSYSIFIKMLIIGIVLIVAGIILKVMGVGIKISKFVSRAKEKKERKPEEKKPKKKKK